MPHGPPASAVSMTVTRPQKICQYLLTDLRRLEQPALADHAAGADMLLFRQDVQC